MTVTNNVSLTTSHDDHNNTIFVWDNTTDVANNNTYVTDNTTFDLEETTTTLDTTAEITPTEATTADETTSRKETTEPAINGEPTTIELIPIRDLMVPNSDLPENLQEGSKDGPRRLSRSTILKSALGGGFLIGVSVMMLCFVTRLKSPAATELGEVEETVDAKLSRQSSISTIDDKLSFASTHSQSPDDDVFTLASSESVHVRPSGATVRTSTGSGGSSAPSSGASSRASRKIVTLAGASAGNTQLGTKRPVRVSAPARPTSAQSQQPPVNRGMSNRASSPAVAASAKSTTNARQQPQHSERKATPPRQASQAAIGQKRKDPVAPSAGPSANKSVHSRPTSPLMGSQRSAHRVASPLSGQRSTHRASSPANNHAPVAQQRTGGDKRPQTATAKGKSQR